MTLGIEIDGVPVSTDENRILVDVAAEAEHVRSLLRRQRVINHDLEWALADERQKAPEDLVAERSVDQSNVVPEVPRRSSNQEFGRGRRIDQSTSAFSDMPRLGGAHYFSRATEAQAFIRRSD